MIISIKAQQKLNTEAFNGTKRQSASLKQLRRHIHAKKMGTNENVSNYLRYFYSF